MSDNMVTCHVNLVIEAAASDYSLVWTDFGKRPLKWGKII